jgi:aspartate ammonia-lyase
VRLVIVRARCAVSAEASTRASADSALQAELDATQVGAGLNTNGSYSAPTSSNYLASATSLKNADSLLDTQLKSVADDVATLGGQLVASVNTITPVAGDVTLTATDISGFATVATTRALTPT